MCSAYAPVTGDSVPASVATQFTWELTLNITVVGKIKVKVVG